MPAVVVPIRPVRASERKGFWSLFEIARPGRGPIPFGILLADETTNRLTFRLRGLEFFEELEEDEFDLLNELPEDLRAKDREMGALQLLDWFEDRLSHFFRVSDRSAFVYSGSPQATVDRLFDEYVDSSVRQFVTHLPVYALRAAATKFGELMESEDEAESWVRAPEDLRLTEGMFVATVVGRSMEPRIPDGSACIFRAPVTGSRTGRLLLIEKFDETDFSNRYTVKRYARRGLRDESAERETPIRLEPLNPEFEAFDLTSDRFRVIAEFVQVLYSE